MLFTWPMVWRALQSTLRSCGFPWELSAPSCTQLSTPRYRCPGIDTGTKYFPEREGSLGKCQRDRWLFWVTPEPGQHYEKQPHLFQTQTVPSAWRLSRFVALRWAAVAAAYRGSRSVSGVQEPGKVLEMSLVSSFVNASSLQCCHFHYPAKRESPRTAAQWLEMPFPKSFSIAIIQSQATFTWKALWHQCTLVRHFCFLKWFVSVKVLVVHSGLAVYLSSMFCMISE